MSEDINIELSTQVSQGAYTNLVVSDYSQEEFVLDFAYIQHHLKKGNVHSRVILTPRNVKKMIHLLKTQLEDYESKFGIITQEGVVPGFPISFN